MEQDSDDQRNITLVLLLANSLSLVGSLFIILAYVSLRLNMFSFRLVVYIAIADVIHSIGLMLPLSQPWCHIQALALEFSSVSSIFWTCIMAYSINDAVINQNNNVEYKERIFLFVGFALPAIITCLPEINSVYGYAGGWCWITKKDENFLWRIFCFYLYVLFVIGYIIVVYARVWRKVYREVLFALDDKEAQKMNKDLIMRLVFYPVVLIVCYTAVATKRATEEIDPSDSNFLLTLIAGLFMSLLGFFDALVYGLSKDVRDEIRRVCRPPQRTPSDTSNTIAYGDQLVLNN